MKALIILLLMISQFVIAQQDCATEAQIPTTTPDSRFIDNNNGTITDNLTKLMWQKCAMGLTGLNCETDNAGLHTWDVALSLADSDTLGGFNDWRLPNIRELETIIERRCTSPSINQNIFPNTALTLGFGSIGEYWSSTPTKQFDYYAFVVNFIYGQTGYFSRWETPAYVRVVRDVSN